MAIPASEAIERLKEGNRRFVVGVRSIDSIVKQIQRSDFVEGQEPFAIILGCSDSRVPAEIIFDQGQGDLFVIRVAGNIVAPSRWAAWNSPRSGSAPRWSLCWGTRCAGP